MSVRMKVWLWFALILGVSTTVMNAYYGRITSVIIAIGSISALCVMLFAKKKWGFKLLCACYALSFIVGVMGSFTGEVGIATAIAMSFIGSIITPLITFLFLRAEKSW